MGARHAARIPHLTPNPLPPTREGGQSPLPDHGERVRVKSVANLLALAAIVLWGTLALLAVQQGTMPPFLLVGTTLSIAGALALPTWRQWRVSPAVLALGIYGLFGFHFFLFIALRNAPPVQANLVNYLWPLLIVLLAPLFLAGARPTRWHLLGGAMGFAGAILAITNGHLGAGDSLKGAHAFGYASALISAFIWATWSLMSQRLAKRGTAFPTAAIGLFCLVSGALALACHALLEPAYAFAARDVPLLFALGIGPMGAAFFLWDAALKRGDARVIGTLAYLTPLISTLLLALSGRGTLGIATVIAIALIVGGALVGTRRSD